MSDAHEGETADKVGEDGTDVEGEAADETREDAADSEGEGADADNVDTADEGDANTPNREPTGKAKEGGTQPPSHPKDRWLNVGVVVGTGVLSAVIALVVCYFTISSAGNQSVDEFRREQRKADYPRILSLATDLKNATDVAGSDLNALGSRTYGNSYSYANPYYYNGHYWSAPQGFNPASGVYTGDQYTANDYYRNNSYLDLRNSSLGAVRGDWQSVYGQLDQAIAEAQIVGTPKALGLARALRDSYRRQYAKSLTEQLDAINEASHAFSLEVWEQTPPAQRSTEPPKAPKKLAEMSDDERNAELNQFIGVGEPDPDNLGYDAALVSKSPCELTTEYVAVAKEELELDEELPTQQCRAS